ncbi:MAG: acyltransferase [Pseudomonadota bacterium]
MKSDIAKASVGAMPETVPAAESLSTLGVGPLRWLAVRIIGAAVFIGMAVNTAACVTLMALIAPIKLLSGWGRLRNGCDRFLNRIAETWIAINNWILDRLTPTCWEITGREGLSHGNWYMLVANHQSWVDILVLQKVFNRRVPMLKFFIKQELLWMPLLGFAWWILDFPFMKRSARGKRRNATGDLDVAMKACEKFKRLPVTVMNFVEGTRCTPEKQHRQKSPYRYLLRPKCGGAAIVFNAMHTHLSAILDVTIVYPQGPPTYWDLVCGRVAMVRVDIEMLPVADGLVGDYVADQDFRKRIQSHFNTLWEKKDQRIARMTAEPRRSDAPA